MESKRTERLIDALDMTRTTRDQLSLLMTLLHTDEGVLILEERALSGLITWISLIDDNLQYIAARMDPDNDPSNLPSGTQVA